MDAKKRIAVIGAGHAGMEAANWLSDAGCSVVLFSNENYLPYFRPRLIAVAFGQAESDAISIKQKIWYESKRIELRLNSPVQSLDVQNRIVDGEKFDGIILSQGSHSFVPKFDFAAKVFPLWNMNDALAIKERVKPNARINIIGGSVLGIETALRAQMAGMQVSLYEIKPNLVNGLLGDDCEKVLLETLKDAKINVVCGEKLPDFSENDFVICATGARANLDLANSAGIATQAAICVDSDLRIAPCVYAAGDIAQVAEKRPPCCVRRATSQAHTAAENLIAELNGEPVAQKYEEAELPLFMKVENVEFHLYGNFGIPDALETRLDDAKNPKIIQTCLSKNNRPIAIRMVGTRQKFNEWSTEIFKAANR